MAGRTHNVAAQATTLGKRFANAGEELLQAYRRVDELLARYPLRGIKGPVGTQQDMLDLLGDEATVDRLEASVLAHLGFGSTPRTSARSIPARSTSTSCRPSFRQWRGRRRSHSRSGSWPATSW